MNFGLGELFSLLSALAWAVGVILYRQLGARLPPLQLNFLQNGLGLPRYDRLALPGGPGTLAGYAEARLEQEGLVDELKFLIDAHGLTRVVLIQHQGCAFYTAHLRVAPKQMEMLQRADLVRAAYFIRHTTSLDNVEAYFARRTEQHIVFEPVPIE